MLLPFKKDARWVLLFIMLGLFVAGCAQNRCLIRQDEIMKPRKVVLRDEAGVERAMLLVREDEARLVLRDAKGDTLFEFGFDQTGLNIEVQDETGKPMPLKVTSETLDQ